MRPFSAFKNLTMPLLLATAVALPTALPDTTARVAPAANPALPSVEKLTPTPSQFALTGTSYAAATDNLVANHLSTPANLPTVLDTEFTTNSSGVTEPWMNLRRQRECVGDERKALPMDPVAKRAARCWDSARGDDITTEWFPQGLSTTGTADGGDGMILSRAALAVAWRQEAPLTSTGCKAKNRVKVALVDQQTGVYRFVTLVEPTSASVTANNFRSVRGHAGGIVWYGNYLYVTDTANGIRVFDLNKMAKVDIYGENVQTVGVNDGQSSACGDPYVLPQVHNYSQPHGCASGTTAGQLCHSWLSLDKTSGKPYKLISGEYHPGLGGRIARYQLNDTGAPTTPGLLNAPNNKTVLEDAYRINAYGWTQGGMSWTDGQGLLNFAFHRSCKNVPNLFVRTWVGDTRPTRNNDCTKADPANPGTMLPRGTWAAGTVQALSHWPVRGTGAGKNVNELWGQTEGVCHGQAIRDDEPFDACIGYTNTSRRSLRAVFAVGFDDPLVRALH